MKVLMLMAATVFLSGCGDSGPVVARATNGCTAEDFGNGVYYFDCANGFGRALSEFRKEHKILSITSYSWGRTSGYWVVTQ